MLAAVLPASVFLSVHQTIGLAFLALGIAGVIWRKRHRPAAGTGSTLIRGARVFDGERLQAAADVLVAGASSRPSVQAWALPRAPTSSTAAAGPCCPA